MIKVVLLAALIIFLTIIIVRTINLSRHSPVVTECKVTDDDFIPLSEARIKRFQSALQFQSVSYDIGNYRRDDLKKFGDFIIKSFPAIHNSSLVEWELVNNYSLLYYIKGSNADLKPYLLTSHLDVVPATNLDAWDTPPFSGNIINGYIYGRGTIDAKHTVMGILESVEYLLSEGIKPVRSFYIGFGHDEEVQGQDGARLIAARLKEKGVTELEYLSDEGLTVTEGLVSGVNNPVASIGVCEKGQVVLKLSVKNAPGHSSMPAKESTVGILAKAVYRLESNPHPSMLGTGVETEFLESLAPEMGIAQRTMIANIWIFKPLLSWFLSLKPHSSAIIRTVTSVTMFNAGVKKNVIPPLAEAIVNHRIHPSQTVQEVIEYDRNVIGDSRVIIESEYEMEPHPTAGHGDSDFGYQVLKSTIRQIWPKAVVVPGILMGNTDTRHYLHFTNNVFRFSPTHFPGDVERFHGLNERIAVKNYEQVINFFFHLIRNSDQVALSSVHEHHSDL
uniref:Peptidase M20 dimerisation domain-containing protein n=1 Tax=Arion vulgaris TaxID=1028688 RepID=A0A0B6ZFW3_9EUPU